MNGDWRVRLSVAGMAAQGIGLILWQHGDPALVVGWVVTVTLLVRHTLPAAGLGGLIMLLGTRLGGIAHQAPLEPATHSVPWTWGTAAMVLVCALTCDGEEPSPVIDTSNRWPYRLSAVLGMLAGMWLFGTLVAFAGAPSAHHHMAMVVGMALGTGAGLSAERHRRRLAARGSRA